MYTLSFSAVFCQKGPHSRNGTTTLLAPASLINHPCWEPSAVSNTGPEGYAQLWPVHLHPRSACQPKAPIPPPPLHAPPSAPLRWAARSSAPSPGPQAGQKSRWLFFHRIPDTDSSFHYLSASWCCCLVASVCLTLCDPMDCSTPGFPVPHHLLEFAQVRAHLISDAIQPPHPLSPLLLPSILAQHQGLFQWVRQKLPQSQQ